MSGGVKRTPECPCKPETNLPRATKLLRRPSFVMSACKGMVVLFTQTPAA